MRRDLRRVSEGNMKVSTKTTAALAGAGVSTAVIAWELWKRSELRSKNRSIPKGQHIVILGAGFAGMNVARELSKLLPENEDGQITLIEQNNFLLFTPM